MAKSLQPSQSAREIYDLRMFDNSITRIDEVKFTGYSVTMEQRTFTEKKRHRHYRSSFWVTMSWMLPLIIIISASGFFLGRDILSKEYLDGATVQTKQTEPMRILTPDEAAKVAKDQDSHVWKEGVKRSDIPVVDLGSPVPVERHLRRRHNSTKNPTTPAQDAIPVDDTTNSDIPVDSPPADNVDTAAPALEPSTASPGN